MEFRLIHIEKVFVPVRWCQGPMTESGDGGQRVARPRLTALIPAFEVFGGLRGL